jgi:hypothetical protein
MAKSTKRAKALDAARDQSRTTANPLGGVTAPKRPTSLDFRGQHTLAWDKIEMKIHSIAQRVMAVEVIGRGATENVHGESLADVFGFLAEDISGDIERLKELLGLGREARP